MATKQTGKQAKNTSKLDTGAESKPARQGERQPRRREPRARSRSVVVHSDIAALAATTLSGADPENDPVPTTAEKPAEQAESQSASRSQAADAASSSISGADRPPASTKRAMLIGMLERPQGASVAEIGERLGWLPHTVRAAFTGMRHAGREVMRSKDQNGRSVYRLAPAQTADR